MYLLESFVPFGVNRCSEFEVLWTFTAHEHFLAIWLVLITLNSTILALISEGNVVDHHHEAVLTIAVKTIVWVESD